MGDPERQRQSRLLLPAPRPSHSPEAAAVSTGHTDTPMPFGPCSAPQELDSIRRLRHRVTYFNKWSQSSSPSYAPSFAAPPAGFLFKPDNRSTAQQAPARHRILIKSMLLLEGRAAKQPAAFQKSTAVGQENLFTSPVPSPSALPSTHLLRLM